MVNQDDDFGSDQDQEDEEDEDDEESLDGLNIDKGTHTQFLEQYVI